MIPLRLFHCLAAGMIGMVWLSGFCVGTAAAEDKKIVVVLSRSESAYTAVLKSLQRALGEPCEVVNMQGNPAQGDQIMQKLQADTTRLVITIGSEAMQAAKNLNPGIPMIYTMVVDVLPFPRQNVSGMVVRITVDDQLKKIQQLFPNRRRIGVVYSPFSSKDVEQARSASANLGLNISPIAVESPAEVPEALTKLNKNTVDVLWMVFDKISADQKTFSLIAQHATQEGLPLIGFAPFQVKAGALAAFSVDFNAIGTQTGDLAKRVLASGKSVGIESPNRISIYVNAKVQKQIGIQDLSSLPDLHMME